MFDYDGKYYNILMTIQGFWSKGLRVDEGSGRSNERSPKMFKIKIPIFRKKNANNFHYDKRSKLSTKYRFLY
jgi:hypothetical protein